MQNQKYTWAYSASLLQNQFISGSIASYKVLTSNHQQRIVLKVRKGPKFHRDQPSSSDLHHLCWTYSILDLKFPSTPIISYMVLLCLQIATFHHPLISNLQSDSIRGCWAWAQENKPELHLSSLQLKWLLPLLTMPTSWLYQTKNRELTS